MKIKSVVLLAAFPLLAAAANVAGAEGPKMKKFLTKPLVIEDQGSFYVGGVPKVTNYASVLGPNQTAAPAQIIRRSKNGRYLGTSSERISRCQRRASAAGSLLRNP